MITVAVIMIIRISIYNNLAIGHIADCRCTPTAVRIYCTLLLSFAVVNAIVHCMR